MDTEVVEQPENKTKTHSQRAFILELLSAEAVLLLVCMVCTCLWLWGDLGMSPAGQVADRMRNYDEMALLRTPFYVWSFPLLGATSIMCGPRETLKGKLLSNCTWIFISFVLMSVVFCFVGQVIPFVGAAAPKMLVVAFGKRAFLIPFIANLVLSASAYLLRKIPPLDADDRKTALLGLILSIVLIEAPYLVLSGHF
ncbi:MAG: hypothetical protein K2X81_03560 [Candidatus Obscuribacterales bacterium]|nr:hypothetical protein [Candidatus Obscuribacterales bacterium]